MGVFSALCFLFFMIIGFMILAGFEGFSFVLEWCALSCGWNGYKFHLVLDGLSLFFLYMLLVCGGLALFYVFHYFLGDSDSEVLSSMILFFLGVMVFLVMSGDLGLSLIFWEYLGLVSFFLILFYTNGVGLRASIVTLVSSRLGDVAFFVLYGVVVSDFSLVMGVVLFLSLLVVLTKSACYPLVGWLIEAMRAPTPVSSLVHSSTLVAAGVWFILRYSWFISEEVVWMLFYCGVVSVVVSGVCAAGFLDLKKIVAFSTCNNVSWCVIFFLVGDVYLSIVQLLSHGVSKCMLFMVVGDLMSSSGSSQHVSGVYSGGYVGGYFGFVAPFLIFSLCGIPFIGVFFTKHLFLSTGLFNGGFFIVFFLLLGLFLTSLYSSRFFCLIFFLLYGSPSGFVLNFFLISLPVFFSLLVNWAVFGNLEEVFLLEGFWVKLFSLVQLVGLISGVVIYNFGLSGFLVRFNSVAWGCDSLILSLYFVFCRVSHLACFFLLRWEPFLMNRLFGVGFLHESVFYGGLNGVGWISFGVFFVFVFWGLLG